MAASKLLSAISIFGLAIGLATAILAALFVRAETTKYHDLPGYDRVHIAMATVFGPGEAPGMLGDTGLPPLLRLQLPGIEAVTHRMAAGGKLRRGAISAAENFEYADSSLLRVLPFAVLHGDGDAALRRPDGMMLGRAMARKYFGRENAVGETLTLTVVDYADDGTPKAQDHVMTVRAVLEGDNALYVSAAADFSPIARGKLQLEGFLNIGGASGIYMRLKPGATPAAVAADFRRLMDKVLPNIREPQLVRLDRLNLFRSGAATQLAIISAIGLLTLFIAGANTVNLMVARATRRQREVGMRKACGAGRRHLMMQFLGEALLSVTIAAILALMLVEWLLPAVNASLQTALQREGIAGLDGGMALPLLLGVALTGLLVGAWPAFVLSGFAPVHVLKGWTQTAGSAAPVRFLLVTAQFAILTVLLIAAGVMWQQQDYAVHEAIRFDIDQVLLVEGDSPGAFPREVRRLPGVRSVRSTGAAQGQKGGVAPGACRSRHLSLLRRRTHCRLAAVKSRHRRGQCGTGRRHQPGCAGAAGHGLGPGGAGADCLG
jgi:putative ABC transport system permease protein